jgi:class 3 adenylate cyclase/tetratricopeptide (TPR) repeat protein/type II secretory pathway predicted ATPase ExeA
MDGSGVLRTRLPKHKDRQRDCNPQEGIPRRPTNEAASTAGTVLLTTGRIIDKNLAIQSHLRNLLPNRLGYRRIDAARAHPLQSLPLASISDAGMKCSDCRFENLEGAKFCNQCGSRLIPSAPVAFPPPSYEENLAKIQRYLPQGLTKRILSQRDRIEGERRHVTVMFCDMQGFTPLVERLGAEAAYAVMDQIYEILIRQVHEYEGTINEMTGDGIMALFGAPIALEEAPQRALWAAHAIHRGIAAFNEKREGQDPIRMRIGIHSGPVVVGTLGNDLRVEFKAVGDTVNLASRMERLAEPGTTYVTREVYKQTTGMFEFESLGKRVIKGRAESLPVYKVLPGNKDIHRPRLGSERMIFTEMVGRTRKLDQLELQVMKLINGEGSIVNVIGEAGIGKSRLVTELKQRESIRRVTFLEGRAISMGLNLSFHPIIDLLKHWAGITGEDGAATAYNKLEAGLQGLFKDRAAEVLPFVATLMGMRLPERFHERMRGIEGEALEKLIRRSVRELLIKISEGRPLVVMIDDLHWADRSSIELLEYLFRLVKQARILFINLFRPGYEETGQRIAAALKEELAPYQIDIVLEPLNDQLSETLIADMLDLRGLNQAVVGQIVQRAGGNPYFIEEVVRSFIDEGAVVLRDGTFKVTDKFGTMTIPNTINDVLMARIDRLDEDARDLLKVAAVIGRNFFYRILAEVAGSVENMDDRLSYLQKTQLILEGERFEELEYHFKHALTQEAAYASILPQRCKALHLKVADTIERVFAEKLNAFYGMLAYHYSRAENLEKAEDALIKAGEEALKTSASSEALHYYLEGLRLYRQKSGPKADAAKVALLEKNIALAFFNRGQYEEAVEYFDKALSYYWKELSNPSRISIRRLLTGFVHLLMSLWLPCLKFRRAPSPQDREAIDLFFKKVKALGIIDPQRFFIESLHFYRRISRFNLTHFDDGYGLFVGASSLFSFSGLSFGISRKILACAAPRIPREEFKSFVIYDFTETLHRYLAGDWSSIKRFDEDLVKQNLDIGEVYWASLHLHWHAIHQLHQGDLAVAQWLVGQLEEISDVYENDFSRLLKLLLNTSLLLECRRPEAAREEIAAGIDFAKKAKSGLGLIHFWSCQAQLDLLSADSAAAEQALQEADTLRRELQPVPWQVSAFRRCRAEFGLSRLAEALSHGGEETMRQVRADALKSCRAFVRQSRKVAQYRTDACRLMGRYWWLSSSPKRAFHWWRIAIREGERLGARIQLARTHFEVGRRLLASEDPDATLDGLKARTYLDKAGRIFDELNLEWDQERLRSMIPQA